MSKPTKYVFVTGGVLSGLGKGITAASIGNILKAKGLSVNIQKCDPYLNVDAGTLNPREHGECFVTIDGAETDLDLGHYERFLDEELTQASSLMAGRVLSRVIADERAGKYQGQSVQIVPHVMNAIMHGIEEAGKGFDVHIVEIGGTVGDLESLSFVEAIRECGTQFGRENCLYVHVVYLPYLGASKEIKTKPAQNAVRELRGLGIFPDVLVARSELPANQDVKRKLAMFCGVDEEAIALLPNAQTIYQVPLTLEDDGITRVISKKLGLDGSRLPKLDDWRKLVRHATGKHQHQLQIGVVAKYLDNQDTYISVFEAIRAAGWNHEADTNITWIDAEKLEDPNCDIAHELAGLDGIVVPGGFGSRGVEGKIRAAQYALNNKLPYLGLCLGMQVGVIAAARRAGLTDANSAEFAPESQNLVINTMSGQEGKENTGGTMRLGAYPCVLEEGSMAAKMYDAHEVSERHRHRYECNNDYRDQYESWGIKAVGLSPDRHLVEMIEAIDHPFFVASQFHPEFASRPNKPHPMFDGLIAHLLQNNGK
ncbi:MAG TPA: CTP synthase [Candidatus Saccharimonadales bacterium]|nr:CTP synthase [Candidatus Saccharimonadales bacterium]